MPGYDSWKTRSPDEDVEDFCNQLEADREQAEADYIDELQQLDRALSKTERE
jgi:hypothetical protein